MNTTGEGVRGSSEGGKGKTEGAVMSVAANDCNFNVLWFDTGATHHVVHDASLLHDMSGFKVTHVVLGGAPPMERNMLYKVFMKGLIIQGGPGGDVFLKGALLVPTLGLHLCSDIQVTARGGECWQGDNRLVIRQGGKVLLVGEKEGCVGMYRVHGRLLPSTGKLHPTQNLELWHQRLGHAGEDVVRRLNDGDTVTEMQSSKGQEECDVCVQAKQTRSSFPRSTSQAMYPFELVHSDLVGPMRVQGLKGER
jgi:hypothetical protein